MEMNKLGAQTKRCKTKKALTRDIGPELDRTLSHKEYFLC